MTTRRSKPQQRRRPSSKTAAARTTSEDQSPMATPQQYSNGPDHGTMPPNVLFPGSRHDAQVEWTMAERVFIPTLRYIFLGFVALILWAVGQGFLVGPWKGDIDKANQAQTSAVNELRESQHLVLKTISEHEKILSSLDQTMRRVDLSVAEISGRLKDRFLQEDESLSADQAPPALPAPSLRTRQSIAKQKRKPAEEWRAAPR